MHKLKDADIGSLLQYNALMCEWLLVSEFLLLLRPRPSLFALRHYYNIFAMAAVTLPETPKQFYHENKTNLERAHARACNHRNFIQDHALARCLDDAGTGLRYSIHFAVYHSA